MNQRGLLTEVRLLSDEINGLRREVEVLRQRLYNSKRDNKRNRDILRGQVVRLIAGKKGIF